MGVSVPTFRPSSYGFPPRRDTVERGSEAAPSIHQKAATQCGRGVSTLRSVPVLERAVGEEAADHEGDLSVAELLHCDGERVRLALEVDEDGRVQTNGNPRELENWMRRCFGQCREKN